MRGGHSGRVRQRGGGPIRRPGRDPAIRAPRYADAAGLLLGFAVDAVVGDQRRWHPVAGFGQAAAAVERRLYAPSRPAGVGYAALAVGVPVLAAAAVARATRDRPVARALFTAAATWTVLGGRTLRREAHTLAAALDGGDIDAARARLGHLCGRDPTTLDRPELARAGVESVAENTSDAVVAPLFWGAVAGLPGLLGYRAVNTLDAMVGHRSERYARFGGPAARLDDAANLAPSRITGLLTVAAAPLAGGRVGESWRVWRRDRADHPSPNAGQCESAMAGALGVRLGGRNVYSGRTETRPLIGDGPRPGAHELRAAARISAAVGLAGVLLAAAARAWSPRVCPPRAWAPRAWVSRTWAPGAWVSGTWAPGTWAPGAWASREPTGGRRFNGPGGGA